MKHMVNIDVIIDENFPEPRVTIFTNTRSKQVENIIEAVENATETEYPLIPGAFNDEVALISQRDIVRIYTENRKVVIETNDRMYFSNRSITGLEDLLNPERFFRISQSEIINLYMVRHFKFNIAGTVGVEMTNGSKTWVARSRVKAIKTILKGED